MTHFIRLGNKYIHSDSNDIYVVMGLQNNGLLILENEFHNPKLFCLDFIKDCKCIYESSFEILAIIGINDNQSSTNNPAPKDYATLKREKEQAWKGSINLPFDSDYDDYMEYRFK